MDCGRSNVLIKRCACMHAWTIGCVVYHEQLFEPLKGQNRCSIEGRRYLSVLSASEGSAPRPPVRSISRSESLFASSSLLTKEHIITFGTDPYHYYRARPPSVILSCGQHPLFHHCHPQTRLVTSVDPTVTLVDTEKVS